MRHFFVTLAVVAGSACQQPPTLPLARALDQAAAWAATLSYVAELQNAHQIPSAYVDVVLADSLEEVQTVRTTIEKLTDVPAEQRTQAVSACDRLIAALTESSGQPHAIDSGTMKRLQTDLKSMSAKAAAGQ